jgi:hypothetical protein
MATKGQSGTDIVSHASAKDMPRFTALLTIVIETGQVKIYTRLYCLRKCGVFAGVGAEARLLQLKAAAKSVVDAVDRPQQILMKVYLAKGILESWGEKLKLFTAASGKTLADVGFDSTVPR